MSTWLALRNAAQALLTQHRAMTASSTIQDAWRKVAAYGKALEGFLEVAYGMQTELFAKAQEGRAISEKEKDFSFHFASFLTTKEGMSPDAPPRQQEIMGHMITLTLENLVEALNKLI